MEMKALIGLLLLVGCHGVSSVMSVCLSTVLHSLKYFCTVLSGVSNFPEFVAVALVDELQYAYYDSNSQTAEPKQAWMDQLTRDYPEYLEMETQRALDAQQRYKVRMDDLKQRFNQTGGAHIYQKMFGCEWDDEDDTTDGYNQFGYDGEDFLVLDLKNLRWIAPVQQAFITKLKWDQDRARLQYIKYYHTKECVAWLKTLLAYGKSTLQRTERPEVSLLQRRPSSPVVCHATGFYPDRVVVFWRRDGEELYEHVDHGEVLPNPDGTFQVSVDLDLASVPREDWRRYECVVRLKGIEDISTRLDPARVRTNWGKTGPGGDGGVKSDITTPIIIVCVVLLLLAAVAAGVFLYKKRNAALRTIGYFYSCRSSNSMEMKALIGLLLLVGCHGVSSVIHSLKFFYTGSSGVSSIPEFVAVGMVDELQFQYYDSNSQEVEVKQSWMDRLTRDDPDYLERETGNARHHHQRLNANIETLKKRFNQTGGVHIYQMMFGCEWDDEDDTTDGYELYGYDGEDFIVLDLKNLRWIAPTPQAFISKRKWDQDRAGLEYLKNYYNKECVDWLKKFLAYGKSTLQRTERPEVSLLQRRPSSPVVCHATGFYPDRVVVFWRRDGEELYEHVDHGEVLPNPDGTFQVSVDLDLASVPREDWRRYECVVQLKGIEDISTPLDPALVRTNWGKTGPGGDGGVKNDITTPIIIAVLILAAVAAAGVAGVFVYKKRSAVYSDVCLSTVLHSLKYFCTASSGVPNFPEFVAVALVDELQIGSYDSNSQTAEPKQAWMDQLMRDYPNYLEMETHRGLDSQQQYKVRIDDLKQRFNQTGGAHIYQVMTGCEWDDEDDTTDGYRQFGYDGEDFIVLDLKTLTWIAPVQQAFITKLSWDQNKAWLQYLKYYYTKECVDWLKTLLAYGKSTLQRTERPEVSLLQRRPSSPVVCHATGFYPDRVVVFWRRDGEELYEHVDHGEVLPNPDGTFQVSVDLDLAEVPREDWRRYECVVRLKGIEDILTPLDPALVRTNWGKTGPGGDGGSHSSGNSEEQNPAPEVQPLTTWSIGYFYSCRSSNSMEMKALIGLLLLVGCHGVSSVIHSLKYFYTASSGVSNFPEFVAVGMVDELQFIHYDSNSQKVEVKQSWMEQLTRDEPDYLERDTGNLLGHQQSFKAGIENLKKRFNQTGGAHIYQVMYGCEWDDEDDTTDGYEQFGYDGEDFIVLDLKTWTWIAPISQAFITKLKYQHNGDLKEQKKKYFNKECVDWLKTLLVYGKSTLQRTERPEVSLLQRRPSSPVVCHATGFYPDRVVVFWRRDGEELYEHVDHGEVLPNPDGTFQVSVDLDLASVPRENWPRYECVVQLKGIEDILTPLDPALVRTNWGKTGPGGDGGVKSDITTPIIIAVLILAAVAAAGVAGVFVYKKRSVIHSLKYFYTGSSGVSNFPEFVAVGMVDELQFQYYDSNSQKLEVKQSWMDRLTRDEPDYLERETKIFLGSQQSFKASIETLKKRFNQIGGVHIYQNMYGCEWDDEDDTTDGYEQYGYDGEDFIVLDLKNLRWIAPTPQAFITKLKWDQDRAWLQSLKYFYTKECVDWLKKFLVYGKSTLQRTERPEVSLLQRRPSSPVVCHATGFYPDRVVVFWRRDGEELYEHVDHGEVLPNPDGTFQVSVDLDLASVPREDWRRYECVVQLKGIEDISTPLDPARVRTNWGKTGPGGDGVMSVCLSTVLHSLKYFCTGSSGVSNFPEFVVVALVDELLYGYYDSNIQTAEPKQAWMDQVIRDYPKYQEMETQRALNSQEGFKVRMDDLKKRFNHTGGKFISNVLCYRVAEYRGKNLINMNINTHITLYPSLSESFPPCSVVNLSFLAGPAGQPYIRTALSLTEAVFRITY
ncbi:Major histocompatibility complex class I-related gene protein [Merluccius polli]|uniref:Major histocompatibility complex class I-related gene protein n=1 Tax=Merluccius polli TaxID=89951 RepID=A0AA47MSW1_MERPO|nr:Major histocompatibility complex class I-related gene protein [Merluccius polli]